MYSFIFLFPVQYSYNFTDVPHQPGLGQPWSTTCLSPAGCNSSAGLRCHSRYTIHKFIFLSSSRSFPLHHCSQHHSLYLVPLHHMSEKLHFSSYCRHPFSFCFHLPHTSTLVLRAVHGIFKILLHNHISAGSNFSRIFLITVHVSRPYRNADHTKCFVARFLAPGGNFLFFRYAFIFLSVLFSIIVTILISFSHLQSSVMKLPGYEKFSTFSILLPLVSIFILSALVFGATSTLVLSILTLNPFSSLALTVTSYNCYIQLHCRIRHQNCAIWILIMVDTIASYIDTFKLFQLL